MAIDQSSNWDDAGTEPPVGEAKYVVSEQPIAEYDNYFNFSVAKDIAAIIAEFTDYFKKDGSVAMTGDFDADGNKVYLDADKDSFIWTQLDDIIYIFTNNAVRAIIANTYIQFNVPLSIDTINPKTAGVGVTIDTCLIKDGYPHIPTHTPSAANDTGTAGQICYDASYIYMCVATDTWKRVAISTW